MHASIALLALRIDNWAEKTQDLIASAIGRSEREDGQKRKRTAVTMHKPTHVR